MNAQLKEVPTLGANGLDVRRTGKITGSRVAAILGLSPYSKRSDVMREMVREHYGVETEFKGNIATQHGQRHEQDAIAWYEAQTGDLVYDQQTFITHPTEDYLAVTIDGRTGYKELIEVKCPFNSAYTTVPEHYIPQLQLQMECDEADSIDFICWRADGTSFIETVFRDRDWIGSVLPVLTSFMNEYKDIIKNNAVSNYLNDKTADNRADYEWEQASVAFIEADRAETEAKERKEAARLALVELSNGHSVKGCGVSVNFAERKGSIAYAKAIKDLLPGADLSKYQSESTTVITVKVSA